MPVVCKSNRLLAATSVGRSSAGYDRNPNKPTNLSGPCNEIYETRDTHNLLLYDPTLACLQPALTKDS
jgi:hypothetical protein